MKYCEFRFRTKMGDILLQIFALTFLLISSVSTRNLVHLGDQPLYNNGLFEGDITGIDSEAIHDRASVVSPRLLWPGGIVYYELTKYTEYIREEIEEAIAEYHEKTCLKFVEKKPEDTHIQDFIRIQWANGCWSNVGRKGGGVQLLSLGDGCHHKGLIIHELGHAIGLFHEHSRSDRDDYVEIIWKNIKKGQETQFQKLQFFENNLLGEEFDYKSIMLYDEKSFSIDGESTTIRVKKPGVVIGPVWKKPGFSESDLRRINKLYQCFGQVRPKPPVAPDFYCDFEEDHCFFEERTAQEGFVREVRTLGGRTSTVLVAESKEVTKTYLSFTTPMYPMYDRYVGCFSFDFYMNGKEVYELSMIKWAQETTHVLNERNKSDKWRKVSVPVSGDQEEVKFFLSLYFLDLGGDGIFAIDNVSFKYSKCD